MESGSSKVQETNKKDHQNIRLKENDSEIDFEEEPRTAFSSQNKKSHTRVTTIIFAETVEEEEEVLVRAERN
jgi:hypothetical protein